VKHLSQKELVHEGFGSFMGKLGGMAGGALREVGRQLFKDTPALTSAATGIANIIKGGLDTDPLIAIKKYFATTTHGKTAFDDDIRQPNSLGKPKPESGNKHKINVPINKGTHIRDGKKVDMAGGRISLTRDDESGKWGINGFFTKDSEENLLPDGAPAVTGGGPAPGAGKLPPPGGSIPGTPGALPGVETGEATPGAEIKDSKGTPMKVGDRVEFTKGAKELKNIQGEIESIQGPEDITIRCGPEGCPPDNRASMAGVHPQMVVQVAAGAGADPGAEPPAEASTTDSEAEPPAEASTTDEVEPPAEASTTDEVEPPAEASTTDEAEPEPESGLGAAPSKEDVELAVAGAAKIGAQRDGNEMNAIKSLKNYMIDTKVTKGDEEVPGGRRTIAKKVQEDRRFRPTIAGIRINNGTAKKLLESKQSQKELLQHLTLLAR